MGYTPVFDSIYSGTLYGRWPEAAVWASLLPLLDQRGELDLSYEAISGMTGWPLDLLRVGIEQLMEPDPNSRSKEHEGRRLIPLEPGRAWGWKAVNHWRYRDKARKAAFDAARQEDGRNAERMRARREAQKENDPTRPDATRDNPPSYSDTNSDTDSEQSQEHAKPDKTRSTRAKPPKADPDTGEVVPAIAAPLPAQKARARHLPADFELTATRRAFAEGEGLDAARVFASFCDYWRAVGGQRGAKLDWDATWRNWCRAEKDRKRGGPSPAGSAAAYAEGGKRFLAGSKAG